uniref:CSON010922 protein n=1 Tax=Culicoides sonorensis TaxID=179676 RepID=A0A336MES5_CULSO
MKFLHIILFIAATYLNHISCEHFIGIQRKNCEGRTKIHIRDGYIDNPIHRRLSKLREQMHTRAEIDAYIITSFDEHLNDRIQEFDERHKYISGFSGMVATIAVTLKSVALWTDDRFIELANEELDCDWHIFKMNESPSVADWLGQGHESVGRVGADPKMVPHVTWDAWKKNLSNQGLILLSVENNLVDNIWTKDRPEPRQFSVKVYPQLYAGEKWQSKLQRLRKALKSHDADAMVITSLTEIAYLLNLRGYDIPYIPVFKAYMLVTSSTAYLYTNKAKITLGIELHLKLKELDNLVSLRNYGNIFDDIRKFSQRWRSVLVPAPSSFDHGASEAIYLAFSNNIIVEKVSPVIYMRAQKNEVEKEGMRRAHIRDAAAMCEVFAYLEQRYLLGDSFTELSLADKIDSFRLSTNFSKGLSLPTMVAFGSHAGQPYYVPSNKTNAQINDENLILIESGGQYLDGTTDVSRTIHLGNPTAEQKKIYTNVLIGLIRLSMLQFPENMRPAGIDAIARGPQWGMGKDYPHATGHGIGCLFITPSSIDYNNQNKHPFREGYFFTAEPSYYRPGLYGVRLENVLEVNEMQDSHTNSERFLNFKTVTLLPFEPKLIDRTLMSAPEKKWLNDYNAKIREEVGKFLKENMKMDAFYWMMNKTQHVIEYLPESEYKARAGSQLSCSPNVVFVVVYSLFLIKL